MATLTFAPDGCNRYLRVELHLPPPGETLGKKAARELEMEDAAVIGRRCRR